MWIHDRLPPIILGTGSPRRHEIFERLGLSFEITKADIDEHWPKDMPHEYVAQHLAEQKRAAILNALEDTAREKLLVTADTVVLIEGQLLGKPVDREEGRRMLEQLSDNTHTVVTGVGLAHRGHTHAFSATTRVSFRALLQDEIDSYLDSYQYADKAGGYGIQDGIGLVGVTRIEGCFYNVLGFPASRFVGELRAFLKQVEADA
ncbi:MAG: Maf family nucleotide pyrophosphatase [Bacteroidota bacterium]